MVVRNKKSNGQNPGLCESQTLPSAVPSHSMNTHAPRHPGFKNTGRRRRPVFKNRCPGAGPLECAVRTCCGRACEQGRRPAGHPCARCGRDHDSGRLQLHGRGPLFSDSYTDFGCPCNCSYTNSVMVTRLHGYTVICIKENSSDLFLLGVTV